jgi:hypothetical protein
MGRASVRATSQHDRVAPGPAHAFLPEGGPAVQGRPVLRFWLTRFPGPPLRAPSER